MYEATTLHIDGVRPFPKNCSATNTDVCTMISYHIRYNIYPLHAAPVEKEEWLTFNTKHNEQQLKRLLIDKWGLDVSIILHQVIGDEQYRDRAAETILVRQHKERVDVHNLSEWHIALPASVRKKLNDDAAETNSRYRNIDQPPPLL